MPKWRRRETMRGWIFFISLQGKSKPSLSFTAKLPFIVAVQNFCKSLHGWNPTLNGRLYKSIPFRQVVSRFTHSIKSREGNFVSTTVVWWDCDWKWFENNHAIVHDIVTGLQLQSESKISQDFRHWITIARHFFIFATSQQDHGGTYSLPSQSIQIGTVLSTITHRCMCALDNCNLTLIPFFHSKCIVLCQQHHFLIPTSRTTL